MQAVDPVITEDMNELLTREVDEQEVKSAVFQLGALKATCPDGFNGLFYQKFWDFVGGDVTKVVKAFFHYGRLLRELNETEIVLIPKVKVPEKITQFRHISLCNFCCKIISKILVNRLKYFLPSINSENQVAFIAKCMIHDNIVVAHEAFHHLRRKKKGKVGELGLKVDMIKAYDRVEWDFLEVLFRKMGFSEKWVNWVMECVRTVSYSLVLNGKKVASVVPKRGIRQGDLLSPYLFIITA